MDELLPQLLAFPPHPPPQNPLSDQQYDDGIKHHIEVVKKISSSRLLQLTSGGENALDVINPALNTVPYTFILNANIHALKKGTKGVDVESIYERLARYLSSYDARQIRYLGAEFIDIVEYAADVASSNQQPHLAVGTTRDALLRLDPSGTVLTTTHLNLVKLALESEAYSLVTPVLDKSILYLPGSSSLPKPKYLCDMTLTPAAYITPTTGLTMKLKYTDVLEYFLYGATVYIALRRWDSALQYLESAITYPARENVSKIMVEAFKKWLLVSVLLEGKLPSLPKSISSAPAKAYHVIAKPYETLAQIFEHGSASRLKSEVEHGQALWRTDCNTGLVLEMLAAYQKFQIRNLAKIYSKISIPEVHSQTTSAETGGKLPNTQAVESLIREMITRGELHAILSNPTTGPPILTFSPSGLLLTEAQMQSELAESAQRISALTREIKQTDRILTHDKDYIKHVQKQRKSVKGASGDQGMSADMDWNDIVEDEDIMGVY